jgi:PEP-CTERM motif
MARRLLLLVFIIGMAAVASATKIQTSDPNCDQTTTITSGTDTFSFNANTQGQGIFCFINNTGQAWGTLLVAIQTQVTLSEINCSTTAFVNPCVERTNPSTPGFVYIYFQNPCFGQSPNECQPQATGVPDGNQLEIDLNCADIGGVCTDPVPSWGANAGVDGFINPTLGSNGFPQFPSVPEPATATLLVSGLGAAYLKRRRRR